MANESKNIKDTKLKLDKRLFYLIFNLFNIIFNKGNYIEI